MPPIVASQTALTSYFGDWAMSVEDWVSAKAESIANAQQKTPNKKRLKAILEVDSGLELPGLHFGVIVVGLFGELAPSNVARTAHFNIVGKAHFQHL